MIAAMTETGMLQLDTFKGGMRKATFLRFVRRLVKKLKKGDVIFWDNLVLHKNKKAAALIRAAGARIRRLPRYSPDLNPIEHAFAKIKHHLRKTCPETIDDIRKGFRDAARCISANNAIGYIKGCGYKLDR